MTDEVVPADYAVRVGERLRAVRKQKRMSLQAVEGASEQEFKASVLGAYERGERSISVPRLQRLAAFYNVPVDQLLPQSDLDGGEQMIDLRSLPSIGGSPDTAVSALTRQPADDGKVTIDLSRLDEATGPERELLRRYLRQIQVQRGDFNGRMLTIREEDVRAIACLFDITADVMRRRLDDIGLRIRVG